MTLLCFAMQIILANFSFIDKKEDIFEESRKLYITVHSVHVWPLFFVMQYRLI